MSGELPFTGFGLTILGVTFGLSWLIGLGIMCIVLGVLALRFASRDVRRSLP
jgi:hypothetical protein